MMGVVVNQLGIEDPYVAANGAMVLSPKTGELQKAAPISRGRVQSLLALAGEMNLDLSAMGYKACYFVSKDVCMQRFLSYNQREIEAGRKATVVCQVVLPRQELPEPIYKMLICEQDPEKLEILRRMLGAMEDLCVTSSGRNLVDISVAGVDKGVGVRQLRELLGVEKKDVWVFGDYDNDLPMFEQAGVGIAMGNGREMLKREARLVAPPNSQQGVAQILKKYILEGRPLPKKGVGFESRKTRIG